MVLADVEVRIGILLMVIWTVTVVAAVARRRLRPDDPAQPTAVPLAVGSGVAAVLFAAQAGVVDSVLDPTAFPAALDGPALAWFVGARTATRTWAADTVSLLGGTVGMIVLAALGAGLLWWRRQRRAAVLLVAATGGAGLLVTGFKHLYDRSRPPEVTRLAVETTSSLPSGHSLGSIVVLGMLAALAVRYARQVAVRIVAIVLAAAAVLAIGVSRLYLGVHWLSDVLTGWMLGGAWLAVCVTVLVVRMSRAGTGPDAVAYS